MPVDLWSVGCILAELLGHKPLFRGRDYVDQLNQILHYLGTPPDETLRRVGSPRAQQYIRSLPYQKPIPFETLYPHANPLALDLLRRLLAFDPAERITCEEALQHPYLSVWHDPADEPVCAGKFDFSFERVDDIDGMKRLILDEVVSFRREVRVQAHARQMALEREAAQQNPPVAAPVAAPQDIIPPEASPYSTTSMRRQQDALPIPSREDIERSSPQQPDQGDMRARATEDQPMEVPFNELERELHRQYQGGSTA